MPDYTGILGRTVDWVRKNFTPGHATVEQRKTKTGLLINIRPPTRSESDVDRIISALKLAESGTNPNRKKLYDLYSDMILDDDYKTAARKRISSVTNLELVYNIKENTENEITDWMKSPAWRSFKTEIIRTIFWGHTLFEFNFDDIDKFWDYYPRKNIEPKRGLILVNEFDVKGIPYRVEDYQDFLSELFSDEPFGWLLYISFPVVYKRNGVGDWALYQELAGNNFNIFKRTSTGTHEALNMDKIVKETGTGGYVELPDGIELQAQNRSSMSQNQLFEKFNRTMSNNILKLILGQSTTTNDDEQGSFAKSLVSLFEQSQVHKDDQVYLLNYLNYEFKNKLQLWQDFKTISLDGEFQFKEPEEIVEEQKPKQVEEKIENTDADQTTD